MPPKQANRSKSVATSSGIRANKRSRPSEDSSFDSHRFTSLANEKMNEKGSVVHRKGYGSQERKQKVGLPFGSILTDIFEQNGVDFTGLRSTPVSKRHIVSESSLKAMNYSRTVNRGWIFYHYLRIDDVLFDGSPLPSVDALIFRRGPSPGDNTGSTTIPPRPLRPRVTSTSVAGYQGRSLKFFKARILDFSNRHKFQTRSDVSDA